MNAPAFTPGEWAVVPRADEIGGYTIEVASETYPIAIVPLNRKPDDVTKANADLAAAAPEMYAALLSMLDTHPPCSRRIGHAGSPVRHAQEAQEIAIAAARAAIAKAEGRS